MPVPLAQVEGCSPDEVKVMSAHCFENGGGQWMSSGRPVVEKRGDAGGEEGKTHVIQTGAVVAVGDNLHGGVGAFFDGDVLGNGDRLPAEIAGPLLQDGGPKGDVEGLAGLVADGEEDGDVVLGMSELHGQRDAI
jgi:hypothetical protein